MHSIGYNPSFDIQIAKQMMKRILTLTLALVAALSLLSPRTAAAPACPPQDVSDFMSMLDGMTDDEKLATMVSTLDEFLKAGGGYSRIFIDDATNTVVEEINGVLLGVSPTDFTPEYLEMMRRTMLEDMIDDYIGKSHILELASKTGHNVEARLNFGDGSTLTIAAFSPEQVAEALLNYQPSQPPVDGDVVVWGVEPDEDNEIYDMLDTVPTIETLEWLVGMMESSIQETGSPYDRAWIDKDAQKVVLLMVDDQFADMSANANEIDDELMDASKLVLLDALMEAENGDDMIIRYFLYAAARVGFDVEVRMCDEKHLNTPFVLVLSPDEVLDAFSE